MERFERLQICSVEPKHAPPHVLYRSEEPLGTGIRPDVTRQRGPRHHPGVGQPLSQELTHTQDKPVTLQREEDLRSLERSALKHLKFTSFHLNQTDQ